MKKKINITGRTTNSVCLWVGCCAQKEGKYGMVSKYARYMYQHALLKHMEHNS